MQRRQLFPGLVGGFLALARVEVDARKRKRGVVRKESMTWKGSKPLWSISGTDVEVVFGWDDAYLNGRIQAKLIIPSGMSATLIEDITPTDWTVQHSAQPTVIVQATFPGGAGSSGQQVGIQILPDPNSHGWDADTEYGTYNHLFSACTT